MYACHIGHVSAGKLILGIGSISIHGSQPATAMARRFGKRHQKGANMKSLARRLCISNWGLNAPVN